MFVMPVAAIVAGYTLWFLLMAILRLPDWFANFLHAKR
jgi:hypothetical protein